MDMTPIERFDHNIQRKIESQSYDLDKPLRVKPKNKVRACKLETMRQDLKERVRRDSNQALLEYIIDLAWNRYKHLELEPQRTLDKTAQTRD